MGDGQQQSKTNFRIESISYGVQDLVYTRVFAMIIVKDQNINTDNIFEVHAFVCDSRFVYNDFFNKKKKLIVFDFL